MFARTTEWTGSPEQLSRWAEISANEVKDFAASLPGNRGCLFLVDETGGRALTITLWSDAETAALSDRAADRRRSETKTKSEIQLESKGRFHVVAASLPSAESQSL